MVDSWLIADRHIDRYIGRVSVDMETPYKIHNPTDPLYCFDNLSESHLQSLVNCEPLVDGIYRCVCLLLSLVS